MPSRPAALNSHLIRVLCPIKQSARHLVTTAPQTPGQRPWSYPPASVNIDNDQVARLASKTLHPLSLADLVRWLPQLLHHDCSADFRVTGMAAHHFPPTLSCPRPTSPFLSFQSGLPIVYKLSVISPSSSFLTHTSLASTTLMFTLYRPSYRTKNARSPTWKRRYNLRK